MTEHEKEHSLEYLKLQSPCKKRTWFERFFNLDALHNWQTRAINRYGLSTYEVCLKCGKAQKRNLLSLPNSFSECDRIKEFDDQFDKNGNYIFN